MQREYHRWYSHRLGMELGVVVHGHWGPPVLGFPTSAGDESELEGQSMIARSRISSMPEESKFFGVNSINGAQLLQQGSAPVSSPAVTSRQFLILTCAKSRALHLE